jgi:hypothetical protein
MKQYFIIRKMAYLVIQLKYMLIDTASYDRKPLETAYKWHKNCRIMDRIFFEL